MKSLKKKKTEQVKKEEDHKPLHIDSKTHEIKQEKVVEQESEAIPEVDVRVEEKNSFIVQIVIPVVIGVIAGVVTGIGVFSILNNRSQKSSAEPSPTAAVEVVSEEKESTDSAKMSEIDLSLYDIKILNGSGKAGEAGKLEKILKAKEFSVLEIGNADKSDYEKTRIQVKEKVSEDYLDELMAVLEEIFDVDKKEDLDSDEDSDVVIIVGSSSKSETTPTPTKTP